MYIHYGRCVNIYIYIEAYIHVVAYVCVYLYWHVYICTYLVLFTHKSTKRRMEFLAFRLQVPLGIALWRRAIGI